MTESPRRGTDVLWERVLSSRRADVRGKALEDLMCGLFGQVPGIEVAERNRFNPARSQEIDIVLWNNRSQDGLWFLPEIVLIEGKNWTHPVGSAEIAWCDHKVRSLGQEYGILVAANGVTGDRRSLEFAHDIIRYALGQRRRLLVITARDLQRLKSPAELVELVRRKLLQLAATQTSID